jgi:hypothetical protein
LEQDGDDGYSPFYPSFRESTVNRGQCVAFAKIATQDFHHTSTWYAGKNVMERVWDVYQSYNGDWWPTWYQYYDPSYEHRGRMIAYFGWGATTGNESDGYSSQYPQHGSPGHVGIFLKYAYDGAGRPYGFWIADENYEGTPSWNNPDGRIRKHLIIANPIPNSGGQTYGHTYANNYFFVDIPQ